MSARRYLTIIQAPQGYAPSDALEPAPPDGPAAPVVHSVVLEADYKALEDEIERLTDELRAARGDG